MPKPKSKTTSKLSNTVVYSITAIAAAAFLFVGSTVFFLKSSALTQILLPVSGTAYSGEDIAASQGRLLIPDPLVTVVPEEQQSAESKSRVFVSTLDPLYGSPTAKVFVIIFGSYTDGTAREYVRFVDALNEQYGDDLAIVWKDFVDPSDESARNMATLAHCVSEQYRPGAYWDYASALADRSADDEDTLLGMAESVGVQRIVIENCMATSGFQSVVDQGYFYGQNIGVENSHTVFVNDRQLSDPLSIDELKSNIDEVLNTFETD